MSKIDPDEYYDQRRDRIMEAQETCPYLKLQAEIEPGDSKLCLNDMQPCERRRHCCCGKW